MASLADLESLLDGISKGEREDFRTLYRLTSAKLFGLCQTILDDRSWAEEVVEGVYLMIWEGALDWRSSGLDALTWILTLCRSEAVAVRQAANHDNPPDPAELRKLSPPAHILRDAPGPKPLLLKVLAWLPADRREAFLLSYFSGVGYGDLATKYRVPFATVRNWQRRSLERLYQDLTRRAATEDIVLAGEYVLGLLPSKERKVFEIRLSREEELRACVAGWNEDFVVLTDTAAEVPPPSGLLGRLDQVLFTDRAKPMWWRMGVVQSVLVAAVAAGVAWAAYKYWPGMTLGQDNGNPSIVQQNIVAPSEPVQLQPLPETGPLLALFDTPTGLLQVGGDLSALRRIPNLTAFLDFGTETEWIALGVWPELPPHVLVIPVELVSIATGAELVVLGGEGSDQEILRITIQ